MPSQVAARDSSRAVPEPPRVANFEDRLKSIITSVLNEDHQNRSKQQQQIQQQQQQAQMQGGLLPGEPERKRHALPQSVNLPDYTQVSLLFVILENVDRFDDNFVVVQAISLYTM